MQVARDQHRRRIAALFDEGHCSDHGEADVVHRSEESVLTLGQAVREFFERVELVVVGNEADDVTVQPDGKVDQTWVLPPIEWLVPRQIIESRVSSRVEELHSHLDQTMTRIAGLAVNAQEG